MRDLIADWNKWGRSERVLALLVTFALLALPVGVLLATKTSASDLEIQEQHRGTP
jgi:hypothetical protein